jgi:inward rectifier potassium channel
MKAQPGPRSYGIRVVGAKRGTLRDAYHWFLMASWWKVLGLFAASYVLANVLFAALYLVSGGIGAQPSDSLFARSAGAFFFSVQTFGTIGYGHVYPSTHAANIVATLESLSSILSLALVTGLVFAKFSRPTARIVFADHAVVSVFEGAATLMLRIGNERGNRVVEAQVHLDMSYRTLTREGSVFYKQRSLKLVRNRIGALARSFSIMHVIDSDSPLYCKTPQDLEKEEIELFASVTGLDDTTGQVMFGQGFYETHEILFGARFADVLSPSADGGLVLDMQHFDTVLPSDASDTFPYCWERKGGK